MVLFGRFSLRIFLQYHITTYACDICDNFKPSKIKGLRMVKIWCDNFGAFLMVCTGAILTQKEPLFLHNKSTLVIRVLTLLHSSTNRSHAEIHHKLFSHLPEHSSLNSHVYPDMVQLSFEVFLFSREYQKTYYLPS